MIEELDRLLEAGKGAVAIRNASEQELLKRNSTQISVALRGLGGIGKTVLAAEYAWRNRARYQGVWLLRAGRVETLIDDLAALGAKLIAGLENVEPEKAARLTLEKIAAGGSERPWLLVYDNTDDVSVIRKWTPANNAHVLITTRLTEWHGEADELPVDVFDRVTAIDYLMKQARASVTAPEATREAAGRLADALDCLPLALSHARSYCWERNWGFDQYVEKLPELIKKAPKGAAYPSTVFATFSLAIEKAVSDFGGAEELMGLIAFFASTQIPLWLIPGDFMTEDDRDEALRALHAVSLTSFESADDGTPTISVHRLVQEVIRASLRDVGQYDSAAKRAAQCVYDAYDFYNETLQIHQRRTLWHPHALTAAHLAPKDETIGSTVIWLWNYAGDYQVNRGALRLALDAYSSGLAIADRLAKADPGNAGWQRDLSVSYSKIGEVLVAQGNLPEALKTYRDSLAIADRLAKADPGNAGWQRDLSVSYAKVGDVLVAQGNSPRR